jgi:hypothetical protein
MPLDLWPLASHVRAGPIRGGSVAKQMGVNILCLGSGRCLFVLHYSSFRPPDGSGVFGTLDG